MKIEKHNSHGLQLSVTLTKLEALSLVRKLVDTVQRVGETDVNHYISETCLFEDDNGRFEPTDFTVTVDTNSTEACQPTYPCGEKKTRGARASVLQVVRHGTL